MLRQGDAKAFKKHSQMKREALAKLNRHANESGSGLAQPAGARMSENGEQQIKQVFGISRRFGRGGEIRTPDPLRPRQVRYQAALRPDR